VPDISAKDRITALTSASALQKRERQVFPVMTQEAMAMADANVPTKRQRPDLIGLGYVVLVGIVMLAWIGGLVWAAMAFFNWLVS